MSSGLGEKCWHLLFVVGRMGLESKGAGVRDARRTGEQEEEERRETELREGLGSDVCTEQHKVFPSQSWDHGLHQNRVPWNTESAYV